MIGAVGFTASVVSVGCDLPPDRPPLRLEILFSDPGPDEEVSRRGPFVIGFEPLLTPRSVRRGRVRVVSGGVEEFLTIRYDVVDRVVVATPFGDRLLEPRTGYRLILEDLEAFDGSRVPDDEPLTVPFRTGDDLGEGVEPAPVLWSEVGPLLQERCAFVGCHGGDGPLLGLDLSSGPAIEATAIGAPSVQLPGAGPEGGRGFAALAGLPRIDRTTTDAGRPSTSYVMYKVLERAPRRGSRMPPPPGALSEAEIRLIERWIRGGAPTR